MEPVKSSKLKKTNKKIQTQISEKERTGRIFVDQSYSVPQSKYYEEDSINIDWAAFNKAVKKQRENKRDSIEKNSEELTIVQKITRKLKDTIKNYSSPEKTKKEDEENLFNSLNSLNSKVNYIYGSDPIILASIEKLKQTILDFQEGRITEEEKIKTFSDFYESLNDTVQIKLKDTFETEDDQYMVLGDLEKIHSFVEKAEKEILIKEKAAELLSPAFSQKVEVQLNFLKRRLLKISAAEKVRLQSEGNFNGILLYYQNRLESIHFGRLNKLKKSIEILRNSQKGLEKISSEVANDEFSTFLSNSGIAREEAEELKKLREELVKSSYEFMEYTKSSLYNSEIIASESMKETAKSISQILEDKAKEVEKFLNDKLNNYVEDLAKIRKEKEEMENEDFLKKQASLEKKIKNLVLNNKFTDWNQFEETMKEFPEVGPFLELFKGQYENGAKQIVELKGENEELIKKSKMEQEILRKDIEDKKLSILNLEKLQSDLQIEKERLERKIDLENESRSREMQSFDSEVEKIRSELETNTERVIREKDQEIEEIRKEFEKRIKSLQEDHELELSNKKPSDLEILQVKKKAQEEFKNRKSEFKKNIGELNLELESLKKKAEVEAEKFTNEKKRLQNQIENLLLPVVSSEVDERHNLEIQLLKDSLQKLKEENSEVRRNLELEFENSKLSIKNEFELMTKSRLEEQEQILNSSFENQLKSKLEDFKAEKQLLIEKNSMQLDKITSDQQYLERIKKDLEEAKANYEESTIKIRKENDNELEKLNQNNQEEILKIRELHSRELQAKNEELQNIGKKAQIEKSFEDLTRSNEDLRFELEIVRDELSQAKKEKESVEKKYSDKLDFAKERLSDALTKNRKLESDRISSLESELENLKIQYNSVVDKNSELNSTITEYWEDLNILKNAHAEELAKLKEESFYLVNSKDAELITQNEFQKKSQKTREEEITKLNEIETDKLRLEIREKSDKIQELTGQISGLRKNLDDVNGLVNKDDTEKSKQLLKVTQLLANTRLELEKKKSDTIALNLLLENEKKESSKLLQSLNDLETKYEKLEKEKERILEKNLQEIQKLKEEYEDQIKNLKRLHEKELKIQREKASQELDSELKSLQGKHIQAITILEKAKSDLNDFINNQEISKSKEQKQYEDRIKKNMDELNAKSRDLKVLEEDKGKLIKKVAKLTEEIEEKDNTISRISKEKSDDLDEKSKQEIERLERKLKEKGVENKELLDKIRELESNVRELNSQISNGNSDLENTIKNLQDELKNKNDENGSIIRNLIDLTSEIERLKNKINNDSEINYRLGLTVAELKSNKEELELKLKAANETIKNIEEKLKKEKESRENDYEKTKSSINLLSNENKDLKSKVKEVESELEETKKEKELIESSINSLKRSHKEEMKKRDEDNKSLSKEIENLNLKLSETERNLKKSKEDIRIINEETRLKDEIIEKLRNQSRNNTEVDKQNLELFNENNVLKIRINDLQKRNESLLNEGQNLQNEYNRIKEEVKNLNDQLGILRNELLESRNNVSGWQSKSFALENQIEDIKNRNLEEKQISDSAHKTQLEGIANDLEIYKNNLESTKTQLEEQKKLYNEETQKLNGVIEEGKTLYSNLLKEYQDLSNDLNNQYTSKLNSDVQEQIEKFQSILKIKETEFSNSLALKDTEFINLSEENRRLKKQILKFNELELKYQKDKEELTTKLEEYKEEIKNLKDDLAKNNTSLKELRSNYKILEDKLKGNKDSYDNQLERLQKENSKEQGKLRRNIEELKANLSSKSIEKDESEATLRETIKQMEIQINSLNVALRTKQVGEMNEDMIINARAEELEKTKNDLKVALSKLKRYEDIEETLKKTKENLNNLRKESIDSIEKLKEELKKEKEREQEDLLQIGNIQSLLEKTLQERDLLKNSLSEKDVTILEKFERETSLSKEIQELQNLLQIKNLEKERLQEKEAEYEAQIQDLKNTDKLSADSIQRLNAQVVSLEKKMEVQDRSNQVNLDNLASLFTKGGRLYNKFDDMMAMFKNETAKLNGDPYAVQNTIAKSKPLLKDMTELIKGFIPANVEPEESNRAALDIINIIGQAWAVSQGLFAESRQSGRLKRNISPERPKNSEEKLKEGPAASKRVKVIKKAKTPSEIDFQK